MPESSSGFAYRAFISYSHHDKAWGAWLHKALETYRVPPRLVGRRTAHGVIPPRLTPVFRDREELASATDLDREVNGALAQSENLIVICSPAAAASRWVNEEVLAYKRMGRSERIFCLIVDGVRDARAMTGRGAAECFCPALRFRLDAKGNLTSRRSEPIAADARRGNDGKADAKLKLIAGMLGVGFDTLKQREQHRKMQRMAAVTALALAVMSATSALAVAALASRHAAVVAQTAAERRQRQAEDLVGFMLGDLNDKLDQMQRLDIIQSVNDKAMTYFASLPPTDVSDTALSQRAKALEKIGMVRMGSGNLAGALEAFSASARISSILALAKPEDAERQVAHSRTLAFIGLVHWKQGQLVDAQRDFEQTLAALRKLAVRPRPDASVLFQLTLLDNNLGHVHEARGQPQAASAYYRERLDLSRRLVAAEPDNNDYASLLGNVHSDLGRLALQRGDLLGAIAEYQSDDAIQTRLSGKDRNDNVQLENMLVARANLGRVLALAGENALGTARLQEAVDTATQLTRFEPDNTSFRLDLAIHSSQLARLVRWGGDMSAANKLATTAVDTLARLTREDPANVEWRKYAAAALLERAAQLQAAGDGDAQARASDALRRLEPILDARPGDRDLLVLTLAATLLVAATTRDAPAARALATRAVQSIRTAGAGSDDPRLMALNVEALLMLDDRASAQTVVAKLRDSGYRDAALLDTLQRARIEYPPNREFRTRLLALLGRATAAQPAGPGKRVPDS